MGAIHSGASFDVVGTWAFAASFFFF